jgi:hypothetical protein
MKYILKNKYYGKILNLLKYKRHKKIKTLITKKLENNFYGPTVHFNSKYQQYFIKKMEYFDKSMNKIEYETKLNRKKYKINSFLFNILCQYSKNKIHNILGYDFIFKYKTIPYRLSLSYFLSNKILSSYYLNINKSNFINLYKKINKQTKLCNFKKEIISNLIIKLENRLDSSLLRLFNFKSLYNKKYQYNN